MPIRISLFCLVALLGYVAYAAEAKPPAPAHRRTEFAFTIAGPFETVAPLFGAYTERLWADGWNPQFVHPQPAKDEAGAVFTVQGGHSTVWINTVYDLDRGQVQYACFAPEGMVTLIDIRLQRLASDKTKAVVVYERTAIHPEANDRVNRLADDDKAKGPEWDAALRAYLQTRGNVESPAK